MATSPAGRRRPPSPEFGASAPAPAVAAAPAPPPQRFESFRWHGKRRSDILRSSPEVKQLFGRAPIATTGATAVLVVLQLAAVAHGSTLRGTALVAHAWMIGATLANSSFLLVHEISHDLVFKAEWANRVLGMVAQLPLLAPMAESFRYYHAFHHKALGVEDTDPDIPTAWEEQLLQLPGALGVGVRLVALALNMIPYLFRPILLHGPPPVSGFMLLNVALQAAFDAAFLAILGWPGVLYTFWAILFAGGLHPSAAHFISEHVAVDERMLSTGQATASSYNWLQALTQFNAGCHTEHHDLPCVPWTRLPLVRRYAPEHYNHLVSHRSATGVIVRFVLGNCRRVKTHAQ